jgi:hypothetical protein
MTPAAETETKTPRPRSKVIRLILIAVALAYFWASRFETWFDGVNVVRYNKWTGTADTVSPK